MPDTVRYEGRDLEALAEMPRYYDWITEVFRPYVFGRAVEYGAGSGTISQRLRPLVDSIDLVEPSANLTHLLERKFSGDEGVRIVPQTLEAHVGDAPENHYDTVVMVNVLEHIERDVEALKAIKRSLVPGGNLLLFVPALPFLFSRIDTIYGHFRRYTRSSLLQAAGAAGFDVTLHRYMDFLGVLPWFLVNKVGGKTTFGHSSLRLYDLVGVPATKMLESLMSPPVGKNLVVVAHKKPLET